MRVVTLTVMLSFFTHEGRSQLQSADCPRPWVAEGSYCYLFSFTAKSWSDARLACASVDARLIAVTEASKHFFVSEHLKEITKSWDRTLWYTGGRRQESSTSTNPVFEWFGAGPVGTAQFWVDTDAAKTPNGDYIAYAFSDTFAHATNPGWFWVRADGVTRCPYICEVEKVNAAKIMSLARGFDFGEYNIEPKRLPRGPRFVTEPRSVLASEDAAGLDPADTSGNLALSFECEASGYPQPTYKWYAIDGSGQERQLRYSADYMMTNGKFTIYKPIKSRDTGQYYCTAENPSGLIRSNPVSIAFMVISEFPTEPLTIQVRAYDYTVIPCKHNNPPTTQFSYQWYFNKDPAHWISTDANPHFFPSKNGNFYIGFATAADANVFHCQIALTSGSGMKRTSPPYTLVVLGGDAKTVLPVIDSPFPLVYPSSPLPKTGDTVNLECFARGTMRQGTQYDYSWSRVDGRPLPETATTHDSHRLLAITDVRPEDAGVYRCTVDYYGYRTSKTVELKIQAAPYFGDGELRDVHADEGETVVWPCVPTADPKPTIRWWKNGRPLAASPVGGGGSNGSSGGGATGRVSLSPLMDELTIQRVSKVDDSGMYQCSATNALGTAYSSAQLRTVAFAPNFINRPMKKKYLATIEGNITLACDPEGAPNPTVTWQKNGASVNVDGGTRLRQLANGDLFIGRVQALDLGVYTCLARNRLGVANDSIEVVVRDFTRISYGPTSGTYVVNSTVTLQCRADYNRDFDIQYLWERNDEVIDFTDWRLSRIYERDMRENRGGLIIKNIGFNEAGYYRCIARTISDEAYKGAQITVVGPPGELVGLTFTDVRMQSVQLRWQRGHDGGASIFAYTVEIFNVDTGLWRLAKNVTDPNEVSTTSTTLDDPQVIFADTSYMYCVLAHNKYGMGPPSQSSASFRTLPAKPSVYPANIGGGGGKVGTLVIKWDLLPREMWNGPNLRYRVSFRHNADKQWSVVSPDLNHATLSAGKHSELIHTRNYYTIYYVRVQAINDIGEGPIPDPVPVYSAEDVPIVQPLGTNSVAYNASALLVFWNPVEESVRDIRGKLLGFNIIYWPITASKSMALRKSIFGNVTEALIIGLEAYSAYFVEVQLFNTAGDSATGRRVEQKTWRKEPQTAPLYVSVEKLEGYSIKVTWQGVQTEPGEEPLDGYKVRIWKQGEHIINSAFYEAGRQNWRVIEDLRPENGTAYNLRVLSYSRGGLGKMSSPIVQFRFGCQDVYVNPEAQYIRQCSGSDRITSSRPAFAVSLQLLLTLTASLHF